MNSDITATIVTSIMPRRIEVQQAAIKSWQQLGFKVVSINVHVEIAILKPLFEDVEFVLSNIGAPLVPISEILEKIDSCKTNICGIVNSDIIFSAESDFISFLFEATSDKSLVFGSRVDIDTVSVEGGNRKVACGYDYFFFRKFRLQLPLVDSFSIGATWWDYWFPTVLGINGLKLRYLLSPVAYHPVHVQHWMNSDLDTGKLKFIAAIKLALSSTNCKNGFPENIRTQGVAATADCISSLLFMDADIIFYGKNYAGCEESMMLMSMLRLHRTQYERVLRSRSWRLTAPARYLVSRIRGLKGRLPFK